MNSKDLFIKLSLDVFKDRLIYLETALEKDFAVDFYKNELFDFLELIKEIYDLKGFEYEKKKNVTPCQSQEFSRRRRCKKTQFCNVPDARRN